MRFFADSQLARTVQSFWYGGPAPSRPAYAALSLCALLYRLAVVTRNRLYDNNLLRIISSDSLVLSVGNLVIGGSGKTPFASWLVGELIRRGARPALLHGGYADDEPALHRLWRPEVPVLTGRDRVETAKLASMRGATVLVLDDGFQHRRLRRDLDIVLIPAETWSDHPAVLPLGPWREPPSALERASVLVVTRKTLDRDGAGWVVEGLRRRWPDRPILLAHVRPSGWSREGRPEPLPEGPVVAVSGIARPDQFEANARALGADLADTLWFGDHHAYTDADVSRILSLAGGRPVVTTAKDGMKLAALLPAGSFLVLEQAVEIEAGLEQLSGALDSVLGREAGQRGRSATR
jgi:tetraacyldisaccharide 4'-kinase